MWLLFLAYFLPVTYGRERRRQDGEVAGEWWGSNRCYTQVIHSYCAPAWWVGGIKWKMHVTVT